MELVKLKMKSVYKISLTIIGFLIVLILILGLFYLVYDKVEKHNTDIEVNSSLSINYIDGKDINIRKKDKIKFSITNEGDRTSYYNISFTNIKGKANYKLYGNKELLLEGSIDNGKRFVSDYISIDSKETINYELDISNVGKSNFKSTIEIRVSNDNGLTFSEVILKHNKVNEPITKVGVEIASQNEGLIKDSDETGTIYYFRGNITNNYVSFAGFTWRILRINSDNTVRLVLNETTDVLSSYYKDDNFTYDYNSSNIKNYLSEWYDINLKEYEDYLSNSKFCNDVVRDDTYNFNAYTRLVVNKIPTFTCLGTSFDNYIGTLTADEIIFAGGLPTLPNDKYFLYNSNISEPVYTITGSKGDANYMNLFMLDKDGSITSTINGNLFRGVRPVINLDKKVNVTGDGTIENPFTISIG